MKKLLLNFERWNPKIKSIIIKKNLRSLIFRKKISSNKKQTKKWEKVE